MPPERWSPGPTGNRVAATLAALRNAAGFKLEQLSELLERLGRRIAPDSLRNSEQPGAARRRRVDVDDLVALALALEVSPVRLLLPGHDNGEPVQLTSELAVPWRDAWRWATGDAPLDDCTDEQFVRWLRQNRPHDDEAMYAAWVDVLEQTPGFTVERDAAGRLVAITAPVKGVRTRPGGETEEYEGLRRRVYDGPVGIPPLPPGRHWRGDDDARR